MYANVSQIDVTLDASMGTPSYLIFAYYITLSAFEAIKN